MKFKVGDVVLGTSDYYSITGKGSINVVKGVGDETIDVKPISIPTKLDPSHMRISYSVRPEDFVKINPKTANILYGGNKT